MTAYHQSKTTGTDQSYLEWAETVPVRVQIKEARLAMGLTQEELCEKAGISGGSHLSLVELGDALPRGEMLVRLSKALGVPLVFSAATEVPPQDWKRSRPSRKRPPKELPRPLPPDSSGKWITSRELAKEFGLSLVHVQHIIRKAGLKRYKGRRDHAGNGCFLRADEARKMFATRPKNRWDQPVKHDSSTKEKKHA